MDHSQLDRIRSDVKQLSQLIASVNKELSHLKIDVLSTGALPPRVPDFVKVRGDLNLEIDSFSAKMKSLESLRDEFEHIRERIVQLDKMYPKHAEELMDFTYTS